MRMSCFGLKQFDHQTRYGRRRQEVAAPSHGGVCETVNELPVSLTYDIRRSASSGLQVLLAQVQSAEVVEQVADNLISMHWSGLIGQVVPISSGQQTIQASGIGRFDGPTGRTKRFAQVPGRCRDPFPTTGIGQGKLVFLGIVDCDLPGNTGGHGCLDLVIEVVGEPFQKQERRDVLAVLKGAGPPASDVHSPPQSGLKFLAGQRHVASWSSSEVMLST